MTTKFTKTFTAALAAAVIGVASLAAPAMAAGQVSISYTPTDADQQQALGTGLQIFSLMKGLSSTGANASQNGNFNAAGFNQNGSGNHGLIVQEGNGHEGTIEQNGNNNNCGLFQFGENTNGQCVQNGDGQSSLTTVFGF
ncbi:MAG: curlin [Alphaproteobacteria bacterium]|nr:curlin [Alphaproteobacteria bacterium]MBU1559391.1 curlin [Alphaproteobacteria bacterium]MBU2301443.1 curlin [Alphaproteobacteria bacterium]MBU2369327.1 curlin [Alphaproteobacteria bacterium]